MIKKDSQHVAVLYSILYSVRHFIKEKSCLNHDLSVSQVNVSMAGWSPCWLG